MLDDHLVYPWNVRSSNSSNIDLRTLDDLRRDLHPGGNLHHTIHLGHQRRNRDCDVLIMPSIEDLIGPKVHVQGSVILRSHDGGFCSALLGTLHGLYYDSKNYNVWVNWTVDRRNHDFRYALVGVNAWNLYFEPIGSPCDGRVISLYSWPYRRKVPGEAFGRNATSMFTGCQRWRREWQAVYDRWVKPHKKFTETAQQYIMPVAVHYRAPLCQARECEPRKLPLAYAQEAEKHGNSFFLATDCLEAADFFKQRWGSNVVMQDSCRVSWHNDQFSEVHSGPFDPYRIGSEILVDLLALSQCKHLVCHTSNVSMSAGIINPDFQYHLV
jgi:hypothetical protein